MNKLFFELIQLTLGNRSVLSKTPTEEEWLEMFKVAQRQAVAGIIIHALDKLNEQGQKPPQNILFEWIGLSVQIRNRNLHLNTKCIEIQQLLSDRNIKFSILKGQGVANYYDKELRPLRQPGDIDVYVNCGRKKAIKLAEELQKEKVHWDYKHLQLHILEDVEIEVHYRIEVLFNLKKNRRLQRWFKEHEAWLYSHDEGLTKPDVRFDLFYVLLHIYRHFLHEGVGLRQVIDYYYVLRAGVGHKEDTIATLHQFGMMRFAQGLMWVMQEVLGMEREYLLCEPCEKEGRFILHQIMIGGNFGKYDSRINRLGGKFGYVHQVIRHNLHLLRHYPADVVWAPVWIVWHWIWRKWKGFL